MQFFDSNSKFLKGSKFNCSTCLPQTQKLRGCHIDSYSLTNQQAKAIPIRLMEHGHLHTFCPAKLFRDSPEIVLEFEKMFMVYKNGAKFGDLDLELDASTVANYNLLIKGYEQQMRFQDYKVLGQMLGGSDDKK